MQTSGEADERIRSLTDDWCHIAVFVAAVDASLGAWMMQRHGIGLTDYRAVAHLSEATDKELRVNDLAEKVGLGQSSVTRLVSRLETRGLARRDVCPLDGRGVYAVITEEGEALYRSARGAHGEYLRELLLNEDPQTGQPNVQHLVHALSSIRNLLSP